MSAETNRIRNELDAIIAQALPVSGGGVRQALLGLRAALARGDADRIASGMRSAGRPEPAPEHEALLRHASRCSPLPAWKLWQMASRETGRMTPFAVAAMWELIADGLLDYDASATVTVVDQRELYERGTFTGW